MLDALSDEPGDVDADFSVDPVAGTIVFQVSIQADEAGAALTQAQTFVRSAMHAAGVGTPGWEHLAEQVARGEAIATVRLSDMEDRDQLLA